MRVHFLVLDFYGDVRELWMVENFGFQVFEVVSGELVSCAYLVEEDVFFERGDVDHVHVVEHRFAIESAENDDFVESEDVRGVALAAVHESERFLCCVFCGLVPCFFGQVEADEFVGLVFGVVASEDVDAVSDAVCAVSAQPVEDFVLVLDFCPGVREGVELVQVVKVVDAVVAAEEEEAVLGGDRGVSVARDGRTADVLLVRRGLP